jgi:hypothetical protein
VDAKRRHFAARYIFCGLIFPANPQTKTPATALRAGRVIPREHPRPGGWSPRPRCRWRPRGVASVTRQGPDTTIQLERWYFANNGMPGNVVLSNQRKRRVVPPRDPIATAAMTILDLEVMGIEVMGILLSYPCLSCSIPWRNPNLVLSLRRGLPDPGFLDGRV